MDIQICNYKHECFLGLSNLLKSVYSSHIEQRDLEEKYITENRSIIIAIFENQVVGCMFLEVLEDFIRPNRFLYVTYVAVDEKKRKNGIGKRMMLEAEKICKKNKCSAIELTSANFRSEAHAFYESLGFTKKNTTHFVKEILNRY